MLKNQSITSVIVTYKVDINYLKKSFETIRNNFANIVLVNNSPEIPLDSFKSSHVTVINNLGNIGLSSALNVGIREAKKQGAQMVALFDQDTLLPDDFSQNMLKRINAYQVQKNPPYFPRCFSIT